MGRWRAGPAVVALLAVAAAGCGGRPARSSLTVFAAASLTEAFRGLRLPGLPVTYSFAGSQQLVAQIEAGAPADVVATADQATMARLAAGGLVDPPVDFAGNRLEIAVAPGNPKAVAGLGDLGRADLRVVLADPSVPAGRYAAQALDRAGVTVRPASLDLDVKAVVQRVASGEADAGVVYVTDVAAAGGRVAGVAIPPAQNVTATYPVAIVRASRRRAAAQAFVDQLLHGRGRDALAARGFALP